MSARFRLVVTLAVGAGTSTALGFAVGASWLLPFLGAAIPFPVFLARVRKGDHRGAVSWVLVWALFQSLAMGAAAMIWPERAAAVVGQSAPYTAEMLHWVRTGEGPEGSPRLFLPIHLRHYLGFIGLSILSAGAIGLALGTFLLNYMNVYVANLIRESANPALAAAFGWPLWAVIRVVGFVVTGAACARLSVTGWRRFRDRGARVEFPLQVFLTGLGLVLLDVVLKATLAPAWRGILIRALTGSP